MKTRKGSYAEFKSMTLGVVRGKRKLVKGEPRAWVESLEPGKNRKQKIHFHSLEAGAKLLSPKNRDLLRTIVKRRPRSVGELAGLTGRAEQNLMRTLRKLSAAGIVRLDKGARRSRKPVVTARKVRFEIDLVG